MTVDEDDSNYLTLAEVATALDAVTDADFRRLMKHSAFMALSVPGMSGNDLLHEAVVRLLAGERRWRHGVDAGATIYKIMLSIAKDTRDQAKNAPIDRFAAVSDGTEDDDEDGAPQRTVNAIAPGTPETIAGINEIFEMLNKVVDGDAEEAVLLSWVEGLSAKEAAQGAGIDMKDYDAARKRLERKVAGIQSATGAMR